MNAILIENGTIIDGAGAAPVPGSVLAKEGAIAAVGAEADAAAAEMNDLERIDATGMTVMPGLIDVHCHLAFDDAESNSELFFQRRNALSALVAAYNAKKLLRAGVTGILDPDSTFENMIDLRDAIDAGVVEGPRMSCGAYALITSIGGTAGRLIADKGVTGYYMAVNGRDEIEGEVRRQIKQGADWIKITATGGVLSDTKTGTDQQMTDDELKEIVDTAHGLGVKVAAHAHVRITILNLFAQLIREKPLLHFAGKHGEVIKVQRLHIGITKQKRAWQLPPYGFRRYACRCTSH